MILLIVWGCLLSSWSNNITPGSLSFLSHPPKTHREPVPGYCSMLAHSSGFQNGSYSGKAISSILSSSQPSFQPSYTSVCSCQLAPTNRAPAKWGQIYRGCNKSLWTSSKTHQQLEWHLKIIMRSEFIGRWKLVHNDLSQNSFYLYRHHLCT